MQRYASIFILCDDPKTLNPFFLRTTTAVADRGRSMCLCSFCRCGAAPPGDLGRCDCLSEPL